MESPAQIVCVIGVAATGFTVRSIVSTLSTIDLTVNPVAATPITQTICAGDSIDVNGTTYNATGIYTDTLVAANGCDSVLTIDLTVNPVAATPITQTICAGDSIDVNGTTYNATGIYTDTLVAANGCDSVLTIDLTVNPVAATPITQTICAGDSIIVNGTTYNATGIYTDTLVAANGCDSVLTIDLTVNPVASTPITQTICAGDSIIVNGTTYNTTGIYTDTLVAANGCDSVLTIDLTVNPVAATPITQTICAGDSIVVNGTTYNATGIYTDTLVAANGCDSVLTIDLTVNPVAATPITQTICAGDSIIVNGTTYNATGIYTDTLVAANGCDSVLTIDLTVNPVAATPITQTICAGDSIIVNGTTYNATGIYTNTLVAANGCDSVLTIDLTVNPVASTPITQTICAGDSIVVNGTTYNTTGIYTDTLVAANGCDSVLTIDLTVNPVAATPITQTICAGDSIVVNGTTYNATGIYTDTLVAANGCDSVLTIDLTVNPVAATPITQTICAGDSIIVNGTTYNATGIYTDTLVAANGCDSVLTIDLTVNPVASTPITQTICAGDSIIVNGTTYNATGIYTDTLVAANGCDSVLTIDLTVNPVAATPITQTICAGDSIVVNGTTYNATGIYTDTLVAANGCDSVLTIDLTVNPVAATPITQTICAGDSIIVNGTTYNTTGIYTDTLVAANGCDSVLTIDLTVNPVAATPITQTICAGDSIVVNGTTYNATGIYTDTLVAANGCDSVLTIDLTVNPVAATPITQTICAGDSIIVNGTTYNATGIYTDTLVAANGCDSVLTIDLTVNPVAATPITQTICAGDSIDVNGTTYNATGIYTDTLVAANGCDSVLTIDLTVNPVAATPITQTICAGDSIIVNGTTYNTTGIYTDTLVAANGCDSVLTIDLTVNPVAATPITQTICTGDSIVVNGTTYNATGIYTDTLVAANGCDSVLTIDLTVNPVAATPITQTICAGDSIIVNGTTYNTTGIYTDTLVAANGCDSVLTIDLTVNPVASTPITQTICAGDSIIVNGTTYNATGIYTDTLVAANGCDSVLTIDLTVNPVAATPITQTICAGDSIVVNGTTYNATGIYTDTLEAANGCDSVLTIDLTVNPVAATPITQTICAGDSIVVNGTTYNATGIYTDTLEAANGCDSVLTIDLTVNPVASTPITQTICAGDSIIVNGTTYNTTGIYTDTLVAANGCDSVLTIDLTVNPVAATPITQTICAGDSIIVNGTTYNTTGIYTDTLVAANGCDSVLTIDLTVNPVAATPITQTICAGDSIDVNGTTYNTTGIYTDTLVAANGCDSVLTIDLTVNPVAATPITQTICAGDSIDVNGTTYNATGIYTDTLVAANGCDSVLTIDLTVNPVAATPITQTICAGDSIIVNGTTYNATGIYTNTLVAANGCDSVLTIDLTVNPVASTPITQTICAGDSIVVNGTTYNTTGIYTDTLVAANGCDSVLTIDLTVNQ